MRTCLSGDKRRKRKGPTAVRCPSAVRRGVTLVEVVVASAVLLIVIVPILKALTIAQMTGRVVERRTQSVILAQGKLDEIRARCLKNYDVAFGESSASLGNSYLCSVTDNQDDTLKLIAVSVGFDADSDGQLSNQEVQAQLTTCVARMSVK
jgi:prepilin-type N-terminal cleavage/methylation domain-containing protein